jgi:hypothetical protein
MPLSAFMSESSDASFMSRLESKRLRLLLAGNGNHESNQMAQKP